MKLQNDLDKSGKKNYSFSVHAKDVDYHVHRTHVEEEKELNSVYNIFTGRRRTLTQQKWQWVQTPFEPSESWVISKLNGGVVGHHGVMALEFSLFGEILSVGKTENTFLLKDDAKKIFYPSIEKQLLKQMYYRFDHIFTTASGVGRGVVKTIRQRLGYKAVGTTIVYVLHFNFKTIFKLANLRFKSKILALAASFIHPILQKLSTLPSLWLGRNAFAQRCDWSDLKEVEEFWKRNAVYYGLTPNRTVKYLKWRYAENPHEKFHLLRILHKDKIIGYAVTKRYRIRINEEPFHSVMIDDLIVQKNYTKNFRVACSALVRMYSTESMLLLVTLLQNDAINYGLRSYLGQIANFHAQKGPELLLWSQKRKETHLFFTNIFSEGVSYDIDFSF